MPIVPYRHRVTYADCSIGNHVYYARYLDILEAARGDFFRQLGSAFSDWQLRDTIFPVVECQMRYKAPARYDDILHVALWITQAERVRLNFAYRVVNQTGKLIVEGETRHVCTGTDEKPKRLPEELKASLTPYMRKI